MAAKKYTKDDCVMLLRSKQESLAANGEERLPKRSDFSEDEVVAIKAFLGPWPRALEAACAIMNDMATFAEASIDDEYLEPIRAQDSFTVEGAGK